MVGRGAPVRDARLRVTTCGVRICGELAIDRRPDVEGVGRMAATMDDRGPDDQLTNLQGATLRQPELWPVRHGT